MGRGPLAPWGWSVRVLRQDFASHCTAVSAGGREHSGEVPGPQLAAKPVPRHTAQGFLPAGPRTEEPVSVRNILDEAG